jgi:hypothetical protein
MCGFGASALGHGREPQRDLRVLGQLVEAHAVVARVALEAIVVDDAVAREAFVSPRLAFRLLAHSTMTRLGFAALAVVVGLPLSAFADGAAPRPSERPAPRAISPTEREARLAFLEDRIATQHLHAQIWWESFITFYGVGLIVQSASAVEATRPAERADLVVSAVKAAGGVVRYAVDPMKGIQSFEAIAGESPAARLARGERILRENADATTPFGPWYAHLINVGINGVGAVIVGAGFDDWERGLVSAGIGIAVGEVSLFTQPWEAVGDLEEYEARFGGRKNVARQPRTELRLIPAGAGAALRLDF